MTTAAPEGKDTTASEDRGRGQIGRPGPMTFDPISLFSPHVRLATETIHLSPVPRLSGSLVCILLGPGTKPGRHNEGCFPLCLQLLPGYNGLLLC